MNRLRRPSTSGNFTSRLRDSRASISRLLASLAAATFGRRALAALLYGVIAFPLALVGFVLTLFGLAVGGVLSVTTVGLWLVAGTVRGALALGALQRGLARRLLGVEIEEPPVPQGGGVFAWRRALLGERSGWRAVACALLTPFTGVLAYVAVVIGYVYGVLLTLHPVLSHLNYNTVHHPDGTVTRVSLEFFGYQVDSWPRWLIPFTLGLLLLAVAPYLLRHALTPHRALLTALLGTDAADRRIRTLEETRAQAVDDAAATLRRIERDLHDGTQARLVGLAMHLTIIRELINADAAPDRVLTVVDTAQGNATQAIADLRHLVKGIHPPVLDQGLPPALASLVADSALPVDLTTDLPARPSPAVESIAYFCAAELLTNAAKHSHAGAVTVTVTARDGLLRLRVTDDGRGGAVIGAGSGLTGLLARVRTVDGTLTCDSPPGGPTVVTVELPM
ncbi:sensor histidine kinase [Streptomyces pseudovenezuelae]|uniref:histidine kinase n=1 Tax=Streptomyces pseudovenezuelae TaxID=67350 RepID=A0ABT6LHV1_9ACTN|nr:sensor domain-containing protein [Streptomyces pseudovenezuelae]MDH6215530.1 signal transduction histidine kinase [Streptomyces pseudovenezuelae]